MLLKYFLAIFIVFLANVGAAQDKDTVLNMVLSKPFFYNVTSGPDGQIFAGTSQGIFEIEGVELKQFNKNKGYVAFDNQGEPVINSEGIRNYSEKKYLRMLPFPDQVRDEYHAGTESMFYICSGGRLYMFDILTYDYSFPNHSIRSISENIVGTYSGIYLKGKKLTRNAPGFCDGYVREIDGRGFVCYDGMLILSKEEMARGEMDSSNNTRRVVYPGGSPVTDIFKSSIDNKFYIVTKQVLFLVDTAFKTFTPVYENKSAASDLCIVGDNRIRLFFANGNTLWSYGSGNNVLDSVTSIPQKIVSGCTDDNRNIYLLGNSALFVVNSDNSIKKLVDLEKAHTLLKISGSEFVISSDVGLFLYSSVSRRLEPLIQGVEFNRRGLFLKEGKLYAGSINGLYTIETSKLNELVKLNNIGPKREQLSKKVLVVGGLLLFVALFLWALLLKAQRKLKTVHAAYDKLHEESNVLDREKIEQYIRENLPSASLKSITEHFKTNNSHIYQLLEPEKPGGIIQKLRFEIVLELKRAGVGFSEISKATGLSESYLKKMKIPS